MERSNCWNGENECREAVESEVEQIQGTTCFSRRE